MAPWLLGSLAPWLLGSALVYPTSILANACARDPTVCNGATPSNRELSNTQQNLRTRAWTLEERMRRLQLREEANKKTPNTFGEVNELYRQKERGGVYKPELDNPVLGQQLEAVERIKRLQEERDKNNKPREGGSSSLDEQLLKQQRAEAERIKNQKNNPTPIPKSSTGNISCSFTSIPEVLAFKTCSLLCRGNAVCDIDGTIVELTLLCPGEEIEEGVYSCPQADKCATQKTNVHLDFATGNHNFFTGELVPTNSKQANSSDSESNSNQIGSGLSIQ